MAGLIQSTDKNNLLKNQNILDYRVARVMNQLCLVKSQVDDLEPGGGGTETDPVFTASPSFSITSPNISNWNTAFGWGNHASAGYLTNTTGDARYPVLTGSYVNPSWITSIPYSKITGTPTIPTNTSYVDLTTAQTVAGNKTFSGTTTLGVTSVGGNFVPTSGNVYELGSATLRFSTVYSSSFLSTGAGTFGTTALGSSIFFRQGATSQLIGGFFGTSGNFILQTGAANLGTDSGQKLQVNGTAKITGTLNLGTVPVYADNAAAVTGGLVIGDIYRTSTGQLMIRF